MGFDISGSFIDFRDDFDSDILGSAGSDPTASVSDGLGSFAVGSFSFKSIFKEDHWVAEKILGGCVKSFSRHHVSTLGGSFTLCGS